VRWNRRGVRRAATVNPAALGEFVDDFSATNNPLGAPWTNSLPGLLDFEDLRSSGGVCFGTVASDTGFPDCYAFHASYSGDYEIEAGIFRASDVNAGINHEVELHVGMRHSGGHLFSCEWLVNVGGSWQCMEWDTQFNAPNFFEELFPTGAGSVGAPADGDRILFRKIGSAGTMHYKQGAGAFAQRWAVTLPFATGSPGLATFTRGGGDPAKFCFTDVIIRPL